MKVFVINRYRDPLMPCSMAKCRKLLKNNKAKIYSRTPFVIQLLYGSSNYKQDVTLGVDAGSKIIGVSAITENNELFAAEVYPRNDIVEKISTKRELRQARRNRKTRYRQPRFDNRVKSKSKGWIAPSIETKIQEHITVIKRVCRILPITKLVVEMAEFDLQKLKAIDANEPLPQGADYQHGEMLNHYNVRQYVLYRDNYTCRYCGNGGTGVKLHAHHLESRKTGGNAPDVFITLCDDCHKKFHKNIIDSPMLRKRARKSVRDAAFMGIMRKTLLNRLRSELDIQIIETRGYITKYTRVEILKLPKTHTNDALSIACGPRCKYSTIHRVDCSYLIKPVRHHNRSLHKCTISKGGIRKSNQTSKYVYNFRLFDKVLYNGIECFIWGRRASGAFLLKQLNGTKIKDGVNYKRLKLLERGSNYLISKKSSYYEVR